MASLSARNRRHSVASTSPCHAEPTNQSWKRRKEAITCPAWTLRRALIGGAKYGTGIPFVAAGGPRELARDSVARRVLPLSRIFTSGRAASVASALPDRRAFHSSSSRGMLMSSILGHVCAVVASLSLVGVAIAQGTTTKPGTVPVPQSSQDKSTFGSASPSTAAPAAKAPSPAKAAAKQPETIQSTKRFAEHTGLVRTSDVVGLHVKDAAGKDAGKIEDLLMDARGDVAYAVVSFGGVLGVGDKLYAVPWNAFIVDREHKTAYLDVTKATLEGAPSFSKDRWPAPSDREWGSRVHSAWNDASITAGVKGRLVREKAATLVKVNVDTNQGVVELNGSVDSEHMKQRATDLARQVDGVRKVVNNLKVQG